MERKTYWRSMVLCLFGAILMFQPLLAPAYAQEEATAGMLFIDAFNNQDEATMKKLIETRAEEFPLEVKDMLGYAMSPDATPDEQDFLFYISGIIAKMYGDHTGDSRLLAAVESNRAALMERRGVITLSPDAVDKTKKALNELGKGEWRVIVFKLDHEGKLLVEIDVKESTSGANFVPKIDFKTSRKAKEIVKANHPKVKKGKIAWSSMGVGLKTAFLE